MYDFETIKTYGHAQKVRINKKYFRLLISTLLVIIPFVTPLVVFVPKIIRRDLFFIVRKD